MINLLQGIVNRLAELFPNFNIYVNNVEQGLIEPCFFVSIVNTEMKKQFSERYHFSNLTNIVCLHQNANSFELQEIKERLLFGLRDVVIGKGYREEYKETGGIYGKNMAVESSNDHLNLTVIYDYIAKFPIMPDPLMAVNKIVHYTNEESYEEATKVIIPGMWETPKVVRKKVDVYPRVNPRDERYNPDKRMWKLRNYKDRYELERERYEEEEKMKKMEGNLWQQKE